MVSRKSEIKILISFVLTLLFASTGLGQNLTTEIQKPTALTFQDGTVNSPANAYDSPSQRDNGDTFAEVIEPRGNPVASWGTWDPKQDPYQKLNLTVVLTASGFEANNDEWGLYYSADGTACSSASNILKTQSSIDVTQPTVYNDTLTVNQNLGNLEVCVTGVKNQKGTKGRSVNVFDIRTEGAVDIRPPQITIDSPSNTNYSTSDVTLDVSADETIDTWRYSVDGGPENIFTPPTTINNPIDGSHTITVYANDTTGNENQTTVSYNIDANAPDWRNQVQSKDYLRSSESVTLSAEGYDRNLLTYGILSTNETGVWKNKSLYGSPENIFTSNSWVETSFTWSNSSITERTIGWKIWYNDTFRSNSTDISTFNVDSIKPSVNILAPKNIVYNSTTAPLNVTSNEEISEWVFNVDDGSNQSFSPNTTLPQQQNGQHQVTVWAKDLAGNWQSSSNTFEINSSAPAITIDSPKNRSNNDPTPALNVRTNENINQWLYNVDSGVNQSFTPNTTLSSLSDGQHSVTVWAENTESIWGVNTRFFTVDTVDPQITIDSPQNTTIQDKTPEIKVFANEEVTEWQYQLNNGPNTSFEPNFTFESEIADGFQELKIWGKDSAGNWNSELRYFTIDTVAPSITIYQPPNNTLLTDQPALEVTSTEEISNWVFNVDGNSNTSFTPNTTVGPLQDGFRNINVYAEDLAGNTGFNQRYFRIDTVAPLWRNQAQSLDQAPTGATNELSAEGLDANQLSSAILATNETGTWQNKSNYSSPQFIGSSGEWVETSFSWSNQSLSETVVAWKIWYNDTVGRYNATDISTFTAEIVPFLDVHLDNPESESLGPNQSFFVNATVQCENANCGDFDALLEYNASGDNNAPQSTVPEASLLPNIYNKPTQDTASITNPVNAYDFSFSYNDNTSAQATVTAGDPLETFSGFPNPKFNYTNLELYVTVSSQGLVNDQWSIYYDNTADTTCDSTDEPLKFSGSDNVALRNYTTSLDTTLNTSELEVCIIGSESQGNDGGTVDIYDIGARGLVDTPAFISEEQNPQQCSTGLAQGQTCNLSWNLTVKGDVGSSWNLRVDPLPTQVTTKTQPSESKRVDITENKDLRIDQITKDIADPKGGQEVNVTGQISNQGSLTVNSAKYSLRIEEKVDGSYVTREIRNQTVSITPASSKQIHNIWNSEPGEWRFTAIADIDNEVTELNETNNDKQFSTYINSYQIFYGGKKKIVKLSSSIDDSSFSAWTHPNPNGTLFFADTDNQFSFSDLRALNGTQDLEQVTNSLNLTGNNDSIKKIYDSNDDGQADKTNCMTIGVRNVCNIPVVNSTNTNSFKTGLVYISENNLDFDGTQDVLAVTEVNSSKVGKYGQYDYEIKIPYSLGRQEGDLDRISVYSQIE